jgi:GNAT superfamily N-acetyltransferase
VAELDSIYGAGTAAAFREQLAGVRPGCDLGVTESWTRDGALYVEATWTKGDELVARWCLRHEGDVVRGQGLTVARPYRYQGLLDELVRRFAYWWPSVGVKRHYIRTTRESLPVFRGCGFRWLEDDGEFGLQLEQRDRIHEYIDWIDAGRPPECEPEWRKGLGDADPSDA